MCSSASMDPAARVHRLARDIDHAEDAFKAVDGAERYQRSIRAEGTILDLTRSYCHREQFCPCRYVVHPQAALSCPNGEREAGRAKGAGGALDAAERE